MTAMMTRFGYPIDGTMVGDQIRSMDDRWQAFKAAADHPATAEGCVEVWLSAEYLVQVFERPEEGGRRLTIRRIDGAEIVARWDVLQAIKNAVVGPQATALEVYPTARDLVDAFNMRHLWVVNNDEARLASRIGWKRRGNADR